MSSSTVRSTPAASRRSFLQQMAVAGVALGPASAFLASCATGGGGDDEETGGPQGDVSEENPLGVADDGDLEIFIFNGGFGDKFATDLHEPIFTEKHPDVVINHNAMSNIEQELQARFVAGDPPDVVQNPGDGALSNTQLYADGLLTDLTPLFDAPSWDDPDVTVRDTLAPGTVEAGSYDGKPYILNYAQGIYGLWYSQKLFDANGWTPPETWDDMLALCAEIQAAGIAPWVYTGVHARYMHWPLLAMAAMKGGVEEVLVPIDNLEEGAWKNEAVLEAAAALADLRAKGYFLPECENMDHLQAQNEWDQGRAAFISCGVWLESEQAATLPADFGIAMTPVPALGSDGALPFGSLRSTAGEAFIVPSDAKNPTAGMEYLRGMLSKDGARGWTEITSAPTRVTDSTDGLTFPPGLQSAMTAFDAAGENTFNWFYTEWYGDLERGPIDDATAELLAGSLTVDQWADAIEVAVAALRDDESIPKQKRA